MAAWLEPKLKRKNKVLKAIAPIQNASLRAVAGAFRATPTRELGIETFTMPIDIYSKGVYARHIQRTYDSPVGQFIKEQCRFIQRRSQRRAYNKTFPSVVPYIQEGIDWANELLNCQASEQAQVEGQDTRRQKRGELGLREWKERWLQHGKRSYRHSYAGKLGPDKNRLLLHRSLRKAESAILVQARTGRIGLGHFLNMVKVPDFENAECECGRGDETAQHIVSHCPIEKTRRNWGRGTTFLDLANEPTRAKSIAKWIIQSGRIEQFRLAAELLYGDARVKHI
jgi:hypothetical protein